jgi:hypothetical protein
VTDKDFESSKALELGYLDGIENTAGVRLRALVLQTLAEPSDRELSDYWYGFHQGKAKIVSSRAGSLQRRAP